ncbi:wax ester/triacylglycerol synthase domain-containing protein [Rhodococcus sp. RDE2]|uniref:wax ester/triacylglycerol synthase domain-containing protein n=1 Tax=Rhodococcus sp. RDE2 TaxID=2885078 RepID=UPI001E416B60|nr:wax ester/triacylglycerol synthase domain-containing protein [Rhodococcus sp. RDE2]BDB61757.1 hypothetical protein RDE2_35510 [Rhodococcus sp. RDE2]
MTSHMAPQLGARDAFYLFFEEADMDTPRVITNFFVFDTTSSAHPIQTRVDALAWLSERLHRAPVLHRRLHRITADLDYPYWVDSSIDLEQTTRFTTIGCTTRRELHRRLEAIIERPIDLTLPPWEIEILADIEGVSDLPRRATIVALRVHHALTDGLGCTQIARALFSDHHVTAQPEPAVKVKNPAMALVSLPAHFAQYGISLVHALRARRSLSLMARTGTIKLPEADRPRTLINQKENSEQRLGRVQLKLQDVSTLAHITGTSINDVILSVVSGALREFLSETSYLPKCSLAARVPRSIRNQYNVPAANKITAMHIDLHTNEADPLTRLHLIHNSSKCEKERTDLSETRTIEAFMDRAPSIAAKLTVHRWLRQNYKTSSENVPLSNTAVSNVPFGPAIGMNFGDSPAIGVFFTLPSRREWGIGHAVSSLGDVLNIAFCANTTVMDDAVEYERKLSSEFNRLQSSVFPSQERTGVFPETIANRTTTTLDDRDARIN